jgi:N-acetylneuraminate synthase
MSVYIIAEIGINHNGSIEIAKKLIDVAVVAGCNAVKFQKRDPELCVPEQQKKIRKETPWGEMSYLDYKFKLEFDKSEYNEINSYCKAKGIEWFMSVWDSNSIDFALNYSGTIKIPSAHLTNDELLEEGRRKAEFLMLSTGMSEEIQIERAVKLAKPDLLFHTNSTYPTPVNQLNLKYILWLKNKYSNLQIGYSGHEFGLVPSFAAVTLGVTYIERHITLDRTMWGSDQMASVEPGGLLKLVKGIRDLELALNGNSPRIITSGELTKLESLRG